jgi:hypothetical protein
MLLVPIGFHLTSIFIYFWLFIWIIWAVDITFFHARTTIINAFRPSHLPYAIVHEASNPTASTYNTTSCCIHLLVLWSLTIVLLQIWDLASGTLKLTLTGHIEQVRGKFLLLLGSRVSGTHHPSNMLFKNLNLKICSWWMQYALM